MTVDIRRFFRTVDLYAYGRRVWRVSTAAATTAPTQTVRPSASRTRDPDPQSRYALTAALKAAAQRRV
jgi:hypothetical protein